MGSRIDPSIALHIDRLATAVAKDPRSKEFLPLADEYMKAGMWQEAAGVLEDGLTAYPGFVTAMAALGRVYDQLNQPVKAKMILEEVVKQRPDNLRAHRILAKLYQAEGKADLALQSCQAILGVNPSDDAALSIKRSITGVPENAPSKPDKQRAAVETRLEPTKATVPSAASQAPLSSITPASPEPMSEQLPNPPALKHAATIARLDGWLRDIQRHRLTRDC